MKTRNSILVVFITTSLLAFCFHSCVKEYPGELDFFNIATRNPDANLGEVKLSATKSDLTGNTVDDHGFLISESLDELELGKNNRKISLGNTVSSFDTTLLDLSIQVLNYYVVAYLSREGRIVYGGVKNFSVNGNINALIDTVTVTNDQAQFRWYINGLQNATLDDHGIEYATNSSFLGTPQAVKQPFGSLNDNNVYQYILPDLEFNEDYVARMYFSSNGQETYSSNNHFFQTRDGWKLRHTIIEATAKGIYGAFATTLDDVAYFGLGCNSDGCETGISGATGVVVALWSYDPTAMTNPVKVANLFNTSWGIGAVAFARTDKIYFGWPTLKVEGGGYLHGSAFRSYSPASGIEELNNPLPQSIGDQVLFTIGDTTYLGSGIVQDDRRNIFSALYIVNGEIEVLESLEPLPAIIDGVVKFNEGRSNAVAVASGGYGYAGAGRYQSGELNDWWRFTPQINGGSGIWEKMADFPGTRRQGMAAFVVENRIFIGLGENDFADFFFNDWWEYMPATDQWIQREPFPMEGRTEAFSFGIREKGYIGGGRSAILNGNFYSDIWEYTPTEN